MPFVYFCLFWFGPPGWIVAAIIYYSRKNAAEQQRNRQAVLDAAYIASGRTPPTPPAKPLPDMSRWSERDRVAYLSKGLPS